MVHLDLFSGIGGFAYAVDQVWDNVEHIFCDNDPFCRQVLKKHWEGSEIFDDIRSITADSDISRYIHGEPKKQSAKRPHKALGKSEPSIRASSVHLLTGGFPCQPFSAAGLRKGTADERHLWPEMLRVIQLAQPTWVIAENVRGILTWNDGLVFEQVCTDLEASGYEVQPLIIPAVAVNAPHRRDRVWFIAHRGDQGSQSAKQPEAPSQRTGASQPVTQHHSNAADSPNGRLKKHGPQPGSSDDPGEYDISAAENARSQRSRGRDNGDSSRHDRQIQDARPSGAWSKEEWKRDWLQVAAELCRLDDGLPVALDGFELSKAGNRKEQIKAYGNAIVPEVAMEIMKGMV